MYLKCDEVVLKSHCVVLAISILHVQPVNAIAHVSCEKGAEI